MTDAYLEVIVGRIRAVGQIILDYSLAVDANRVDRHLRSISELRPVTCATLRENIDATFADYIDSLLN